MRPLCPAQRVAEEATGRAGEASGHVKVAGEGCAQRCRRTANAMRPYLVSDTTRLDRLTRLRRARLTGRYRLASNETRLGLHTLFACYLLHSFVPYVLLSFNQTRCVKLNRESQSVGGGFDSFMGLSV